jgi:phosphohistidine phosphatase
MIYLVHHADALPPEVDPQRPLSGVGRASVDRLASDAVSAGVAPVAIWHSGKLRARQTAEAFLRACNPLAECSAIRGLQPGDPPEWVRDVVAAETREVMLVGHMPHLPKLYTLLLGGDESHHAAFPQHGLVGLDREGSRWVVRLRLDSLRT